MGRLLACLCSAVLSLLSAEAIALSGDDIDPATAYVDQLIEPLAEDSEWYPEYEEVQEPEGYRSFSTEYRHYQQNLDHVGVKPRRRVRLALYSGSGCR
jgi:hypothetical protein